MASKKYFNNSMAYPEELLFYMPLENSTIDKISKNEMLISGSYSFVNVSSKNCIFVESAIISTPNLGVLNKYSVSFFVRMTTNVDYRYVYYKMNPNASLIELDKSATGVRTLRIYLSPNYLGSNYGTYEIGASAVWKHIVLACDDLGRKVYYNGSLVYSDNTVSLFGSGGVIGGGGIPLNSQISQFMIWSKALTIQEVAYLYNNGNGNEPYI